MGYDLQETWNQLYTGAFMKLQIDDRELEVFENLVKDASGDCYLCKNSTGHRQCKAFPDLIPLDIWTWKFPHTQPYQGDKGIMFERRNS